MQDIATKVEGSQLTAEEFNQIPSEIENVITSTGQSLTNADVRQLVKAISIYTGKGDFYNTSGTANNIILNPIDNMQTPIAYNDGLRVRFIASATNTNSVTINILGLASCELLNAAGSSLAPGELVINKEYSATYLDGKFRLFASDTSKVNLNLGNSTAITNCITEIPQDIKLELNNGVLTLKAGSKVYVPNGVGKFDEVVITKDFAINVGAPNGQRFLFARVVNPGSVGFFVSINENIFSGSSQPTPITDVAYWYDTTNNVIKLTQDKGATWTTYTGTTLSLASVNFDTGVVTNINQVFNGFGYIGSTIFALPGVKGLIPNGRNADGTLKNIEFTTDKVLTRSFEYTGTYTWTFAMGATWVAGASIYNYNEDINYNKDGNGISLGIDAGTISYSSGVITSFTPKQPFRAVDYNDVALKQNFQVVSTLPSSPQPDVFYFIPESE